jgi:hypothetical protein
MEEGGDTSPFKYHLELTPKQLKVTHTALRALADDFGHDEAEVHALIEEVLAKLPDEHAIRAIQLDREPRAAEEILAEAPEREPDLEPPTGEIHPADPEPDPGSEPPPTVA